MSMDALLFTETGRVVPSICEEITTYRHVRKILIAPEAPAGDAMLYLHVRRYPCHDRPLVVTVNGCRKEYPAAPAQEHLHWACIPLPEGIVHQGENVVDLSTAVSSQTGWSVSLEDGHLEPRSYLSTDSGLTWQNRRMGIYHVQRGEYLIRVRSGPGSPPAPEFVWENPSQPRLAQLRELIPARIRSIADAWQRARALSSWVSSQWSYTSSADGAAVYTPWDPFTILAWKPGNRAHGQSAKPIRMCVHYGIVFVCACLSCGIPARAVIATRDIRRLQGHFVAEIWDQRFDQWSMVDPNLDLVVQDLGRPLGACELFNTETPHRRVVHTGASTNRHLPRLADYLEEYRGEAVMFRHVAVWPRNDFLSQPAMTPACHGQQAYSETEIVWLDRNGAAGELGMFPFLTDAKWFHQPPPAEWRSALRNSPAFE